MRGSFHDEALYHIFTEAADTPEVHSCLNFRDVFLAVIQDKVDAGLVAVENSLYGSINEVYRLFAEHDMWITHEVRMHIEQCLIACKPTSLIELRAAGASVQVLSQAPALAQVTQWLDMKLPDAVRVEAPDTAVSVQTIMDVQDPLVVAIAGIAAANQYGATVVERNIQDDPGNYTRFMFFTKRMTHSSPDNAEASSLILTTDHSPGSLYRALGVFNDAGINLSKLDSHPIPGDAQHYAFYIDVDQPAESPGMKEAATTLEQRGYTVKLLGSYIRHT